MEANWLKEQEHPNRQVDLSLLHFTLFPIHRSLILALQLWRSQNSTMMLMHACCLVHSLVAGRLLPPDILYLARSDAVHLSCTVRTS